MNTEDPNPTYDNSDLIALLDHFMGMSMWNDMIVVDIDHINIDFFWSQFWRHHFQTWVSIPNQKQFRFRIRNKSPPQ